MNETSLKYLDETSIKVHSSDLEVHKIISDHFTFMVPGYKFSPKFKAGIWDGKIRLYNLSTKLLPIGLLKSLMRLLTSNNIQFSVDKELSPFSDIDLSEIDNFIHRLNLHARGVPVEAKNYQIAAVKEALKNKKKLLLSPTSSGKSMILYIYIRYQIDVLGNDVVLIVPTTQLVEQMYEDFKDYSSGNGWSVDEMSCKIYAGKEKLLDRRLVISTWASIVSIMKRDRKSTEVILGKTGALCCDEAHQYKAEVVSEMCAKFNRTPWKLGVTGTIDESSKVNVLQLTGLFSEPTTVISTKELQDIGVVSRADIRVTLLEYPEYVREKITKGSDWDKEKDFLITNPYRNSFIADLAMNCKGVTLILFTYIGKHGDLLFKELESKASEYGAKRQIKYIHGQTDIEDREEVRNLAKEEDIIILASSSLFSTGTNIPAIENIIFAMPTKSSIRVRQSIGRGLRLSKNKTSCRVFDIADDLRYENYTNSTYRQMLSRLDIYRAEEFDFSIKPVKLKYPDQISDGPSFLPLG